MLPEQQIFFWLPVVVEVAVLMLVLVVVAVAPAAAVVVVVLEHYLRNLYLRQVIL